LYSEKIVEAGGPLVLDIFCDSGNIEMYTWDKDGVKFEMTKRVRGTESEEILSQKLNNFNIDINENENKLFSSRSTKAKIKIPLTKALI